MAVPRHRADRHVRREVIAGRDALHRDAGGDEADDDPRPDLLAVTLANRERRRDVAANAWRRGRRRKRDSPRLNER
jgi:hypothetical protein